MPLKDADHYRERPTGEILKEQQELESLRSETFEKRIAWWEWSAARKSFDVSESWERLTGYKAEDLFPQRIDRLPVELLDDLIDELVELVHPDDQKELRRKAKAFVLFNNSNNFFEHGYRFRMANGSYKTILSTARSVWKDRELITLFCQTRDIEQYTHKNVVAVATVKNTEAIAANENKLKEVSTTAKHLTEILIAAVPTITGLVVALVTVGGGLWQTARNTLSTVLDPVQTKTSPAIEDDVFALTELPDPILSQIRAVLYRYVAQCDRIVLIGYEPGVFPGRFRVLLQAEQLSVRLPTASEKPQPTLLNDFTTERTQLHIVGSPHKLTGGDIVRVSYPFIIQLSESRTQTFAVSVDNKPSKASPKDDEIAQKMAAELKIIIQKALNTDA